MASIDSFRTSRLNAERIIQSDYDALVRMHQDARVMATLGGVRSEEETGRFLQDSLEHWDGHGYGLWIFRDPREGEFVGRAGLRHVEVGGAKEVEVAYALRAEAWGKGLATEIARYLVDLAFETLALRQLVCLIQPANVASRRVIEKVGFGYECEVTHASLPHLLYRLVGPRRGLECSP